MLRLLDLLDSADGDDCSIAELQCAWEVRRIASHYLTENTLPYAYGPELATYHSRGIRIGES